MFFRIFLLTILTVSTTAAAETPDNCKDCWKPDLQFDIEGQGMIGTMIFISGHSYSLTTSNQLLKQQGKSNFFCKDGDVDISSKELIDILNKKIKGVVKAEEVSSAISEGLVSLYPCKNLSQKERIFPAYSKVVF
jgi:hypothetical protein